MGFYIRQLLAGKDFAKGNLFATQMVNNVYLVGDDEKRVCMVVDPAWDVRGILDIVDAEGMELIGALATHYHPDHVGGQIFGHEIEGLGELLDLRPVKIYVNAHESEGLKVISGVSDSDLKKMNGGDEVMIGDIRMKLLHTPGHTPGSQCFLAEGALISGDTLFIGGCGRVDLPGGNSEQLYYSLTQVLGKLPADTILYPGHHYAARSSTSMGEERNSNRYLRIRSLEDWKYLMS